MGGEGLGGEDDGEGDCVWVYEEDVVVGEN